MNQILRRLLVVLVVGAMVTGCATVSRSMGKLTSNKYAEARSGTVWITPPPQLDPPSSADRSVYISYRNISDAQNVQLLERLKSGAREQGWTIVNDPNTAKYRLRASLRYFGEVTPESGGRTLAANLGGITGAASGIAAGIAIADAFNSDFGGLAGGLAVGGLVGAGLSNASKPREWAFILDVVLEEYSDKPVEYTLSRNSGSGVTSGAGTTSGRSYDGGGTRSTNSSSASMTKTSHYYPHGVRLTAWTNQMAMTEEEAMPHLESRIQTVVNQMLPI